MMRCLALAALGSLLAGTAAASPAQDYALYCMGCHGSQAQGVPGKIPPLALTLVPFMRTPEGRNYLLRVPGAANSALADAPLTALLNWLAVTYAPANEPPPAPFSVGELTSVRRIPLPGVQAARRELIRKLSASGGHAPAENY